MKTLHFDLCGGASGDMLTAGLLACGVPADHLKEQLQRLPVADAFSLRIEERTVGGFFGTTVHVDIPKEEHHHRHLPDIENIVQAANYTPAVYDRIMAVFTALAQAEAAVHGTTVDKIHFHEVGAVDSIVDICAVCIAVDYLQPDRITTTSLPSGHGTVQSAHGLIPLPAPATAQLAREGIPLRAIDVEGELTTPTAAALMTVLADAVAMAPEGALTAMGTALGHKRFDNHHNMLRIMLLENGTDAATTGAETVVELCSNIDDASPQVLAWTIEKLLDAGALDAWLQPVVMKKGRPGFVLNVLCQPEAADDLKRLIFSETDTLGIRYRQMERDVLQRCIQRVNTFYGELRVKGRRLPGSDDIRWIPEYDDCAAAASEHGVPLNRVMEACRRAAEPLDWPESG